MFVLIIKESWCYLRKLKVKYLILTVITIPFLLFSQSYIKYKINNINNSCTYEVKNFVSAIMNQDNAIYLKDYLDFNCDGFYIIYI